MNTPLAFHVFEPFDGLLERRQVLSEMNVIPDMRAYASAWLQLADDFQSVGLLSNAGICRERGNRYAAMAGGEFIRLTDGSISELIEVS